MKLKFATCVDAIIIAGLGSGVPPKNFKKLLDCILVYIFTVCDYSISLFDCSISVSQSLVKSFDH